MIIIFESLSQDGVLDLFLLDTNIFNSPVSDSKNSNNINCPVCPNCPCVSRYIKFLCNMYNKLIRNLIYNSVLFCMRFIIPFILILTLASCTSKVKLLENCADEDFLNNSTVGSFTDYEERRDFFVNVKDGKLSLQEKLKFNPNKYNLGSYEKYYKSCENYFNQNPETFKQKYK